MTKFEEYLWSGFWVLVAAVVAAGVLWMSYKGIVSDARRDYCYITVERQRAGTRAWNEYELKESRVWAGDTMVGIFDTYDAAAAAAKEMGCPLE